MGTTGTSASKPATIKAAAKLGVFTLYDYEYRGGGFAARAAGRSRIRHELGILLSVCGLGFLIPVSLVAAELASMFPYQQGGMFRWIGEAFGRKAGFLGIWLQWVESTIWFPTVLTFGAVSLAFIGMDHVADSHLAANKLYTIIVVLAIYWIATLISMKGLGWVGKNIQDRRYSRYYHSSRTACGVRCGLSRRRRTSQMDFHGDFIPDFSNFDNIVLAASIFLFYAGMEMSGIACAGYEEPMVNYPEGGIWRCYRHRAYIRPRHIRSRSHNSCQGHQPCAEPARRL